MFIKCVSVLSLLNLSMAFPKKTPAKEYLKLAYCSLAPCQHFTIQHCRGFDEIVENNLNKKKVFRLLGDIDISGFEFGDLKTELEVFSGAFGKLGIDGFDFGAVLEADTFFSIDTLINTISIFEAEGVDISDTDFVQEWILSLMYF